MWTIIHVNYFVPIGYHLQDLSEKLPTSSCDPVVPRFAHAIKNARRQEPAPPKAVRGNLTRRRDWTNKENSNRNSCNRKCGRKDMHRDRNPNARTKITRHAKNACGVEDKMTTKVAAVL